MTADLRARALDTLFSQLMVDVEWSVRRDNGFSWVAHHLRQDFDATGPFESEGYSLVRVAVSTPVLTDVKRPERHVLALLSALNRVGCGEALVWDRAQRQVSCCLGTYVHATTLQWRLRHLGAYALIALTAYEIRADQLARIFDGSVARWAHPTSGHRPVPDDLLNAVAEGFAVVGREPSRFAVAQDFAVLCKAVRRSRYSSAKASAEGIAIEVPWSDDATSLVHLQTNKKHPTLGAGLLVTLKVPPILPGNLAGWAVRLNRMEADGQLMVPSLGAWCVWELGGTPILTHALFVPNTLYSPGVSRDIAMAEIRRAEWAAEELAGTRPRARSARPSALEALRGLFRRRSTWRRMLD